jgi:hypothetical protein
MLGVMDELVALYRHMYKQGCCAHILNFLLEDGRKNKCLRF